MSKCHIVGNHMPRIYFNLLPDNIDLILISLISSCFFMKFSNLAHALTESMKYSLINANGIYLI